MVERMKGVTTLEDFAQLAAPAFQFLEASGYVRCPAAIVETDPRDVTWRLRYHRAQRVIDVEVAVGLGLSVNVRTLTNPGEAACTATAFSAHTNIETVASNVSLPTTLRVRGSDTLYQAYNNHVFAYQKVLRTRLPEALSYLAARLEDVLNGALANRSG